MTPALVDLYDPACDASVITLAERYGIGGIIGTTARDGTSRELFVARVPSDLREETVREDRLRWREQVRPVRRPGAPVRIRE